MDARQAIVFGAGRASLVPADEQAAFQIGRVNVVRFNDPSGAQHQSARPGAEVAGRRPFRSQPGGRVDDLRGDAACATRRQQADRSRTGSSRSGLVPIHRRRLSHGSPIEIDAFGNGSPGQVRWRAPGQRSQAPGGKQEQVVVPDRDEGRPLGGERLAEDAVLGAQTDACGQIGQAHADPAVRLADSHNQVTERNRVVPFELEIAGGVPPHRHELKLPVGVGDRRSQRHVQVGLDDPAVPDRDQQEPIAGQAFHPDIQLGEYPDEHIGERQPGPTGKGDQCLPVGLMRGRGRQRSTHRT